MRRAGRQLTAGLVALGICCVGAMLGSAVAFAAGPEALGVAPSVATGEAKNLTQRTATLEGVVNPMGVETSYHFAFIGEAGYQAALAGNPYAEGETTASLSAGSSEEPQAVGPVLASGLLPGTTYHYALVAE